MHPTITPSTPSRAACHGRPRTPILVAAAAAATLGLLAGAASPAAATITPGRAVAGVKLGDSAARVKAVLGTPEKGSNVLNYRYVRRHGLGVYLIAGRVYEITVLRKPRATKKKIRVGSSRKAVVAAYPKVRCRRAVVGRNAFECRLPGRFARRATETVFTTRNEKVVTIAVHFV